MSALASPLLVVVLLINLFLLGTSRVRAAITGAAAQGVLLGVLALVIDDALSGSHIAVAAGAIVLKGIAFPALLARAIRDLAVRREIEPLIGLVPSLLIGAIGTAASLLFASSLPLAPAHEGSLVVPGALATVFTGFMLLTTRRKAITQVVGYLVLENGLFIMGLGLLEAMPFLVEVGILLDLFVGIFVMGIIINHMRREFGSIDTERLTSLRE
ncbi:MAG: hydrogenase [Myxococcales bacterium]|nr:hydrogenase [Myxococcales bacterium]